MILLQRNVNALFLLLQGAKQRGITEKWFKELILLTIFLSAAIKCCCILVCLMTWLNF